MWKSCGKLCNMKNPRNSPPQLYITNTNTQPNLISIEYRDQDHQMGRNNSWLVDQRCKKHPSHKQSKGVCPSCLREKLSHLSSTSSSAINHSDSSSCSSLSPCSLSDSNLTSPGSPPHHHHQQESFSFVFSGGKALKKSRSLAFVEKKKNKGFLSKLIGRRKEKDVGELLHSKTLKERSSTNKWALFS